MYVFVQALVLNVSILKCTRIFFLESIYIIRFYSPAGSECIPSRCSRVRYRYAILSRI